MSATMEDTKVAAVVKPEQTQGSNTSVDHNQSERGGRGDRNSNGRIGGNNRGFKREGMGNQRGGGGGYRRGGSGGNHPSHGQMNKEEVNDRDQRQQYQQQRNYQRPQHNDDGGGQFGGRNNDRIIYDKLKEMGGPTHDLPPLEALEKKFSARCRLYLGNIPPNVEESEIKDLIKEYGEVFDIFLNREKKFCFVRMDYHYNAEKAQKELNGKVVKNYTIKVRFAPHGATVKVKNMDEHVSNELLHLGFSVFGEIDRAIVTLDDRGKPTGEGIVEFSRKNSALLALRKCTEGCFLLTNSIRPVIVEAYEPCEDQDGNSDRFINKNNPDYQKSRSIGPRLAHVSSFEHEFGTRWKQLFELQKRKQEALVTEFEMEKNKLVAQMEFSRYEHETAMLREELRAREMDMDRQKRQWEQKQTQAEEERRKVDERMRIQQERMQPLLGQPDDREQQEANLFLQAQQLTNLLECQEKSYYSGGGDAQLRQQQGMGGSLGGDGARNADNTYSIGKRRRY